ncbi:ABC transporter permease subunit [Moorellaceae bacterium AZ2]
MHFTGGEKVARFTNLAITILAGALLVAFAYFAYQGHRVTELAGAAAIVTDLKTLPYYAFRSFLRMLAAYILSFVFSLVYGYKAGSDRRAEKILLPVLDVLQSVPILGFFPAAVYFFINLFRGSILGIELASIFLIFTSQVWNMTFGFYESLRTIPKYLSEACSVYGLNEYLRLKRLYLPAGIPKLVYNSILSWAGGWYFLIAAEIIALGPIEYSLPGLGSYLIRTVEKGELGLTLAGLLTLIFIIGLMNIFIWRPLAFWSEKFKYEFDGGGGQGKPKGLGYRLWWQAPVFSWVRAKAVAVFGALIAAIETRGLKHYGILKATTMLGRLFSWGAGLLLLYALVRGLGALAVLLSSPWEPELFAIPKAIFYSFLRLAAAYLLSLAWTLPVAIWLGHNERAYEILTPVFEVLASVPATALFPVIVFVVIRLTGKMDVVSVLLLLTGMQWYLLFNLIAGVRNIPRDIKQAASAFGVKGLLYLRRVVFPAMIPSLITGSITAWGGGWNALIVAEYIVYAGRTFAVFGIGSLLDEATYGTGNFQVIWASLIAMMITIILMNRLVWRPLFTRATARFRIEG